ncbi:hypothetical protein P700755_003489 [Psychroflexus torquis ATCC 700755]|uniref:Uncharacterized protein n=1 Tax=Psychroflexus torquis (strain ATCC 700755 / CIP 106069 / ACAM 623) TaxID=313595 RepID=K4IIE4_PSYTT|nr:hypothetical protein [Psychroflexus torquis]AFU70109.1 hypothetical protein P700755_003489 [Psychroflexus torquis ATCC 700755]
MTDFEKWQIGISVVGVLVVLFTGIMAVWIGQKQIEINNRLVGLTEIEKEPILYLTVDNFRGFDEVALSGKVEIRAKNYSSVPISITEYTALNMHDSSEAVEKTSLTVFPGTSVLMDVFIGGDRPKGDRAVEFKFRVTYSRYLSDINKCVEVVYALPKGKSLALLTPSNDCKE